uniref:Uncharacterized protein n=1 Tax=Meloidogyne incognita TaxID=6306 RepID=A0A914KP63_MELIC
MKNEDNHWLILVEDFNNNPINGIRGKGIDRKNVYVQQEHYNTTLFDLSNLDPSSYEARI